ncbi:hypothetical protein Q5P01_008571 [Channa striata]|uniref:Uncharacterized protein n=1 Tax=Channa striata TaxID=64152 RepID=A0AA88MZU0_CHASR|nr:hypothetical protein Q5P01_008571 [Channa striata]
MYVNSQKGERLTDFTNAASAHIQPPGIIVGVLRYGQVQMALSQLSPNRISQNTPVTAGTCAPSQSGAATETNYHQQSSRCRVHGACASPSPYKVAKTRRQINGVVSVCQLGDRARFYGDSVPLCCS